MLKREMFEPNIGHELCDTVEGVDGAFLMDLYDCIAKFGDLYGDGNMRIISRKGPKPLYAAAVVGPAGNHNMRVSRLPNAILRKGLKTIVLMDLYSAVMWDGDITVQELQSLIDEVDEKMQACGLIDDSGSRVRLEHDGAPEKLRVEDVFTKPGMVYVLAVECQIEDIRDSFDKPEELHFVVLSDGKMGFVHTKDRKMVQIADLTRDALARHGMTHPSELNKLPEPARNRVLSEVVKKVYSLNN